MKWKPPFRGHSRTLAQATAADNHGVDACTAGALVALALVVVGFAAVTVVGQRRGEDSTPTSSAADGPSTLASALPSSFSLLVARSTAESGVIPERWSRRAVTP